HGALFRDRLLDQLHRLLATDVDRDDRTREQHGVTQRKDRDDLGHFHRSLGGGFLGGHTPIVYARRHIRQWRRALFRVEPPSVPTVRRHVLAARRLAA